VIGDYILDQYIIGETGRGSREAPVVVVNYQSSHNHPGGAANAARNVVSLGGQASALGIVGDDAEGRILAKLLTDRGVEINGLKPDGNVHTSLKMRIMAGELRAQKQQVSRVDRSCSISPGGRQAEKLMEDCTRIVAGADAVLISDYGTGLVPGPLSEAAIAIGRSDGIPVVIDSRFKLLEFKGATAATPNEVEAIESLELKNNTELSIKETAGKIIQKGKLDSVVITRGSLGMYVCENGGKELELGILGTDEATDVTGAGDTVAAAVALSLAAGSDIFQAAEIATSAAAVVVMKRGAAEVTPEEITKISYQRETP